MKNIDINKLKRPVRYGKIPIETHALKYVVLT